MKKKIVSLCLVMALVSIAAMGTLAYFSDTDQAENTFTVGNVDITLTEPLWDAAGAADAGEVYPGEPLAKNPVVINEGSNPCFVRIRVEGLDCLKEAGLSQTDITTRFRYAPGYNEADWTYRNGYYYYNSVLAVDSRTSELFDQIVIPTDVTNGGKDAYAVTVTACAVQAQGARPSFAAVQEMTVEEIEAWFISCGM